MIDEMITRAILERPLPKEAVKEHPTKKGMSAINAMYVYERMNDAYGAGNYSIEVREISSDPFMQKTKNGERPMFRGVVHVTLTLPNGTSLQEIASSDNDDEGDAMKGATTDAMTKLASKLGIASYIWMNKTHEHAMNDYKFNFALVLMDASAAVKEAKEKAPDLEKAIDAMSSAKGLVFTAKYLKACKN